MNLSNYHLIVLAIILKYNFDYCQINDNYETNILEGGNYDLIDIKDYLNLSLIITTSKKIYAGIPPSLKTTTTAKLIKQTSIITINENYILAACLQDSFFTKINLNSGSYTSLISYRDFTSPSLSVPSKSCSITILDNIVFVGYSQNKVISSGWSSNYVYNKTMLVLKIPIKNKNSQTGPTLDSYSTVEYYPFPLSTVLTDSSSQIACEPLRISNNINDYRVVCLHETSEYIANSQLSYYIYATSIREDFNNFEIKMNEFKISNSSDHSGFKIYKLNDTHARCLSKKVLVDIYLTKRTDNKVYINGEFITDEFHSFTADLDLFNYNNGLRFTAEKTSFMNINNIYAFRINKETVDNYYTAYDYKETNIVKFIGYYDKNNDYILFLYQTGSNIKYFTLKDNEDLYNFGSYSKIIQMKTNEHIEYNINELVENFSNFGNLNVVQITRNLSGLVTYENFGLDFYDYLINDNIFIPEESNKTWYRYDLSFIEHINNNITRIYYLKDVNIIINTCFSFYCVSCLNNYNVCDACIDSMTFKSDELSKCYHIDKLIKGYIYNETNNLFEKCFHSCDFCYATSINESEHNCESCAEGYLFSYQYKGNCYKINDLQIDEEKKVENIINENYISSVCSLYKIYPTGECVNECPTSDIYFSFEYDSNSSNYIKTSIDSPKY